MALLRLLVVVVAVVLVLEAVGVSALSTLEGAGYNLVEWLLKRKWGS
jgi:hypothetical protein